MINIVEQKPIRVSCIPSCQASCEGISIYNVQSVVGWEPEDANIQWKIATQQKAWNWRERPKAKRGCQLMVRWETPVKWPKYKKKINKSKHDDHDDETKFL